MKSLSLKTKLVLLSLMLGAVIAVVGGIGYFGLKIVVSDFRQVTDVSTPNMLTLGDMANNLSSARAVVSELISDKTSEEIKKNAVLFLEKALVEDEKLDTRYREIEFTDGQEVLYKAYRDSVVAVDDGMKEILKIYKKENKDEKDNDEMNTIFYGKVAEEALKANLNLEKLFKFHREIAAESEKKAIEMSEMTNALVGIFAIILTIVGQLASYLFSTSLTRSLVQISSSLDRTSSQVSAAATQIASSSESLAQATTEQAASLEETSAAVDEMNSMISISAENSKMAAEFSASSQKEAEKGRQVVSEMVNVMNLIHVSNENIMKQINVTTGQMEEIVNVIKEIETKTKVINDIVFQTKLLSFNASVEAARAGEQGKGFAVVAEEVGNLASMSGNAANEIAEMLSNSVHKVVSIVDETKSKVAVLITDGQEKLKRGADVAKECDASLSQITSNITEVTRMGAEISTATYEQSKGIQEITKALTQLDHVTQTNSTTSNETSGAADSLAQQARDLQTQVLNLVTILKGEVSGAEKKVSNKPLNKTPSAPPSSKKLEKAAPIKIKVEEVAKKPVIEEVKTAKVSLEKKETPPPAKKIELVPKKEVKISTAAENKNVIGSGKDAIPSYDHPGFEDV